MPPLGSPERQAIEAAVTAFEAAWHSGTPPSIEGFLPAGPTARNVLVELAHIDLEFRLKAGQPARVEDYLSRFPELAADPVTRRELVLAEYRIRSANESDLRRADYAIRFPDDWQHLPPDRHGAGTTWLGGFAAPPGTPPPPIGPDIPGLRLIRVLGEGMGVVYLAHDEGLNRHVALKTLGAGRHASPEYRARFRTEAEAIARLAHDNIVQVFAAGEHDGVPFFTMEYLDGGNLAARIGGTPQSPAQAARWVADVAGAVAAAHAARIIHRDLKPQNVLLAADGRPKVADFGLAQFAGGSGTATGTVMGTASYMAPEQAAGKNREVGPPADIWALGAILYECLTGRPPFRGESRDATLAQVLFGDPVAPRRLVPGVPRDLETIALKCLHRDPGRRYPTAAAMADDLRRYLDGRPILARPVGLPERVWRWCRRNPALATLAAALVLVIMTSLAGLAYLLNQAEERRRDAEQARARAEMLLQQMSETDAATQSVLYEFVVDEVFPSLDDGTTPDDVRRRFKQLEVRIRTRFADHPILRTAALQFLANGYSQLASVTDNTEDQESVRRLLEECVAMTASWPEHPIALQARNNLLVFRIGREPTAERVTQAQGNWAECSRVLGPDHSLTITSHHNLGYALWATGRHAEAEASLRECLATRERVQGANYPQTYDTRMMLARAMLAQPEKRDEGCQFAVKVWAAARHQFGPTSSQAAGAAWEFVIAEMERDGRDPSAVIEPLRDVLVARPPGRVPDTLRASTLAYLGWALLDAGRPAEAEPYLSECVAIRQRVLPGDDWRTANARVLLGAAIAEQSRYEQAEPILRDGYDRMRAGCDPRHPRLLEAWNRVARLYQLWKQPQRLAEFTARNPRPQ